MSKPFSPDDAMSAKVHVIPEVVIDAVNQLLATKFSGSSCTLRQDEIIDRIAALSSERGVEFSRQALFANHWLDIEPVYEKEGWTVYYDKPAYCESYEPTFKFTRKK